MGFWGVEYVPGTTIEKPTATPSNGNAFAWLGACRRALKDSGVNDDILDEFMDDAKSDDHDHLVQTCMMYCEIDG